MDSTNRLPAWKREWYTLLTSIQFLTRIPIRGEIPNVMHLLERSTRYFPLVGMLVALLQWPVFVGLLFSTDSPVIATWGMMFAGILVTGAFHEDGLADVCDAFGGGWTKPRILEIMKDSRLGTFGVVALIGALSMKQLLLVHYASKPTYASFWQLSWSVLLLSMFAHAASRLMPVLVMQFSSYVRDDAGAKSKPLATQRPGPLVLIPAALTVFIPLLAGLDLRVLLALVPMLLATASMARYFIRWIGGYTGDCLGSVQQIAELIAYLSVIALWKFGWFVIPVLP